MVSRSLSTLASLPATSALPMALRAMRRVETRTSSLARIASCRSRWMVALSESVMT